MSGAETRKCSDEMVKQMEEFASKLLSDEITVYNKRTYSFILSSVKCLLSPFMLSQEQGQLLINI